MRPSDEFVEWYCGPSKPASRPDIAFISLFFGLGLGFCVWYHRDQTLQSHHILPLARQMNDKTVEFSNTIVRHLNRLGGPTADDEFTMEAISLTTTFAQLVQGIDTFASEMEEYIV